MSDYDNVEQFELYETEIQNLKDEIERLRETVQGVVVAYDQSFPMRTADYHSQGCKCLRCAVDEARAALGEGKDA